MIHGFIMLERAGTFGMPVDVDESFRWLVERYVAVLDTRDDTLDARVVANPAPSAASA
jgi:hypothetical protein